MGLPASIASMLFAVAYATLCAAVGHGLFKSLLAEKSEKPSSLFNLGLAFALGQGVLSTVWVFLSLLGWFTPIAVAGSLAILSIPGFAQFCRSLASVPAKLLLQFKGLDSKSRVVVVGLLSLTIVYGVRAFGPFMQSDAIGLYLLVPRWVALTGILTRGWLDYAPSFSYSGESHYSVFFLYAGEQAALLFDYVVALNCLAGVFFLARSFGLNTRASILSVCAVFSIQAFENSMAGGKLDIAAAQLGIYAIAAVMFSLKELESPQASRMIGIAGLLAGFSITAKISNVLLVAVLGIPFLWEWVRNQSSRRPLYKFAAVFFGALLLAMLPHFIKSYAMLGEPLVPFLLLSSGPVSPNWTALQPGTLSYLHGYRTISNLDLALLPLTWTFVNRVFMDGNISPMYLAFLPLGFFFKWPGPVKIASLMALTAIAAWIIVSPYTIQTRYHYIGLSLLAVPVGFIADQLLKMRAMRSAVLLALLLTAAITLVNARKVRYAVPYVTGALSRDAYFKKNFLLRNSYGVASFLNENTGDKDRVYLARCDWYSPYFMKDSVWLNSQQPAEAMAAWEKKWNSEFWQFLADQGFGWVTLCKSQDVLLTGEPTVANAATLPPTLQLALAFENEFAAIYQLKAAP